MKTTKNVPLDFQIDKLTNSIENTSTGEVFDTLVVRLTAKDLSFIHKSEWQFDWSKVSFDKGYQGFLAFDAKTTLIKHYEEMLHATHFRGLRMFIETNAALSLISQYFKS
jgi:hypothetical protein